MAPTPLRIAQTTSEAKKLHKKHGPRVSVHQQKQLERLVELDNRVARIRENDERRRAAKKRREEQERKEKQARKHMGVGLATQLIGYSHTQAQLKNGMEAFLGVKKRNDEAKQKREAELAKTLEAIADSVDKEPWDDDDDDDNDDNGNDNDNNNDDNGNANDNENQAEKSALDVPGTAAAHTEQWADDDLDDDTLLEMHDLLMSDPVDAPSDKPQPPPTQAPPAIPPAVMHSSVKEDAEFVRTHGPINKAVEAMLDKLPTSLVELLSLEVSMRLPDWNPALALLHKLNPIGLPPHRLRIKPGCVVSLLRDLNTSSQLSKSQHLRVLRIESDRLECLVLDGQLEGTKTFLTRIAFLARYRNDEKYLFQRTQYPIRVASGHRLSDIPQTTFQSNFKLPSVHGRSRLLCTNERPSPAILTAKSHANPNPSFKRPGLPASKSTILGPNKPVAASKPIVPVSVITDEWADFLESGTQIARELSAEAKSAPATPAAASPSSADCLPPLSTQDFDFSLDDLDEEPHQKPTIQSDGPPPMTITMTHLVKPSTRSQQAPRTVSKVKHTMPPPLDPVRSVLKRKSLPLPTTSFLPPPKRPCDTPSFPRNPCVSLGDFGLSTQDVVSFFDDDEVWS